MKTFKQFLFGLLCLVLFYSFAYAGGYFATLGSIKAHRSQGIIGFYLLDGEIIKNDR